MELRPRVSNEHLRVRICNQNKSTNYNNGCHNVFYDNSMTNIVVLNDPGYMLRGVLPATGNERAHAIRARIGAHLEAAGVTLDEFQAAFTTVAAANEARRVSIGRTLAERISDVESLLDFVRGMTLPGMRQLRLARRLIADSLSRITTITLEASGFPAMIAAVGLPMLVSQGRRISMACVVLSVGLFALGKPHILFKYPNVHHFIVVVDFFDNEVQIPFSEATSSVTLHSALTRHFAGKIVLVLLQQRRYELQATEATPGSTVRHGQTLPERWIDLLQPGSRLNMNALFGEICRDKLSRIICPACSSPFPGAETEAHSNWLMCPRCSSEIRISRSEDERSAFTPEERGLGLSAEKTSKGNIGHSSAGPDRWHEAARGNDRGSRVLLERAFRQCRRIRAINVTPAKVPSPVAMAQRRVGWSRAKRDAKIAASMETLRYLDQHNLRRIHTIAAF